MDSFRKDNCLSGSSQEFMNDYSVMKKQEHLHDHESRSHETMPLPNKENCPYGDQVSGCTGMNTNHVNMVEVQSSVNLVSRNSTGQNSISTSFSNENASTIVYGENSKDNDVSVQTSNGVAYRVHISAKSDISSETGPLVNRGSNLMDAGTSIGRQKHMTESSCSNSTQVARPVSSSNDSYQETSTEAKSPDHHAGGSSSSIPAGFESSIDEPVTSHAVSDIAAQITQKAVDNIRARGQIKGSEIVRDRNGLVVDAANTSISSLHKQRNGNGVSQDKEHSCEVDHVLGSARQGAEISIYSGASESTTLNEERNAPPNNDSVVQFGNPSTFSCLTGTEEEGPSCNGKGEGDSVYYQHIADHESNKNQSFSALPGRSEDLNLAGMYEHNGLSHGKKSSESILARLESFAAKGKTACFDRFNLNEDIQGHEFNGDKPSACETGYSCNVIRVVAKHGVPLSFSTTPLKFQGEKGWKGSAATSAFHSPHWKRSDRKVLASKSNSGSNRSKGLTEIDLNVTAAEDNAACGSHLEVGMASLPLTQNSSTNLSSSRAERLSIDLNCLGDTTDMFSDASKPIKSTKIPILDLDLNEDPSSEDICHDVHQQDKSSKHASKITSDSPAISFGANSREIDYNFVRPACWADFSSVQFYSQAQTQPFLVAAPNAQQPVEQMQKVVQLQPKLPYIMHTLPSQTYPSSGSFFVYPNGSIASNITCSGPRQYARDPRVHTAFPLNLNHGTLPFYGGAPHFMQVANVRNQNEAANMRSYIDVMNGGNSAVNGSIRDTREYLPQSKCLTVEEKMKSLHEGALGSSTGLKRTEPDGGHGSYQLGTRQFTSWN